MSIIKSIIRTYFIDLAIDTGFTKLWLNFMVYPKLSTYPKNAKGLLECARRGELYTIYGKEVPYEEIKDALIYGFPLVWDAINAHIAYPERFVDVEDLS